MWKDEDEKWRNQIAHRMCQKQRRVHGFIDYQSLLFHQNVHILYQIEKKHQKILMNFLSK